MLPGWIWGRFASVHGGQEEPGPHGIQIYRCSGGAFSLTPAAWSAWVREFWEGVGVWSWSSSGTGDLKPRPPGRPHRSGFYFRAGLLNAATSQRSLVEGNLGVAWKGDGRFEDRLPAGSVAFGVRIAEVDARQLELRRLRGGGRPSALFWRSSLRHRRMLIPLTRCWWRT